MTEKYWSLQKLNGMVLDCLKNKYNVVPLQLSKDVRENQSRLDSLYKKCDAVIYLASKLIAYRRNYDKPTFFFAHAWMDHGAGIKFYLNRDDFRRKDFLLFSSTSARNKFNQVYSTDLKTAIVPYFTANKKVKLSAGEEKKIRQRLGIPGDCKIFIYCGRFSPEKNIESLFELIRRLENEKFVILAVGDFTGESTFGFGEDDQRSYRRKIERMFASKKNCKLIFVSKLDDNGLNKLMSIAFLAVNLTLCREEDFGLFAVEAMAAGLPVVASDWGGLKDVIRNGKDGFLIKTSFSKDDKIRLNMDKAVALIKQLLAGKIDHDNLADQAFEQFERKFSTEAFLKNISKLLDRKIKPDSGVAYIAPKSKYKTIYDRALKNGTAKKIYLDNPVLFKDLYKHYLSK